MPTIWKAPLSSDGTVDLPAYAKALSVQMQGDKPMVWALVDLGIGTEKMRLNVYGTGHDLPDDPGRFIGTIQMHGGALVFHVFQPEQ